MKAKNLVQSKINKMRNGLLCRETLNRLQAYGKAVTISRKEILYNAGDAVESLFYLIDGRVAAYKDGKKGLFLGFLAGSGEWLGESGILDPDKPHFFQACGQDEGLAIRFSIQDIHTALNNLGPGDRDAILKSLGCQAQRRCVYLAHRAVMMAHSTAGVRVLDELVTLCNSGHGLSHPDGVQIQISRLDLSRLCGCSREMAGRSIQDLQTRGFVRSRGKTIVVIGERDKTGLITLRNND